MAENWKRKAARSSQITNPTFLKSKGRMVSVFPWNYRAVFQIVFRCLLHVHMLLSIEWINYFQNENDEYFNKYYKTNSSYFLRKLGMMFRVFKAWIEGFICGFNFSLLCKIFATWFLQRTSHLYICWFVNETPLLKPSYHP